MLILPNRGELLVGMLTGRPSTSELTRLCGADTARLLVAAKCLSATGKGKLMPNPRNFWIQREDGCANRLLRPHQILIEMTRRCNLACTYCALGDQPSESGPDLPPRLFDRLCAELIEEPVFELLVSGGEPLLWEAKYGGLFERLELLRKAGIRITLFSNGSLLARYLTEVARAVDRLQISLDAPCAELFARMANAPELLFHQTAKAIRSLAASGQRIQVNAVVTHDNLPYIHELVDWGLESRVAVLTLNRVCPLGRAASNLRLSVTDAQWNAIRVAATGSYSVLCDRAVPRSLDVFPFGSCKAGRSYMVVNSDGSVSPCIAFKHVKAGDLWSSSLHEVWRGGEWERFRTDAFVCPLPGRDQITIRYNSKAPASEDGIAAYRPARNKNQPTRKER